MTPPTNPDGKVEATAALPVLDAILAGLIVLPSMIEAVKGLVRLIDRLKNGESVSLEEVEASFADLRARSGRIQDA